jgi:ABC-2 type transport system permease protein
MKKNSRKRQLWIQLGVVTGIIIAVNIISSIYYQRIDLTNDHRYTLSEPTKKLVKNVNDIIFVKVCSTRNAG